MELKARITDDVKSAMKSHDAERLNVLRMLMSAIKNAEIEQRAELSLEAIQAVLRRECKKRAESAEIYKNAGRDDLSELEIREIAVIKEYLPAEMNDAEIRAIVESVIATGEKNVGKIIGAAVKKSEGRATPQKISEIVKSLL